MDLSVMMVLGARPQFIKSAPVIHELLKRRDVRLQLINSGQHYDYELSQLFFEELKLPRPVLNLEVGSGSHATQTAKAMVGIERSVLQLKPDLVLVPGDTNTTLAAALASAKLNVPVGHFEAGARSYDMTMPEEVNRILTDHVSSMLFAPTKIAERNLRHEGIPARHIFHVGDTMVDGLKAALPLARKLQQPLFKKMELTAHEFVLTTAHRPANVDNQDRLDGIVRALLRVSKRLKVVFPTHPRIAHRMKLNGSYRKLMSSPNIILTKPLGYLEIIALLDEAGAMLTDSGGLQKEAFLLGTPCVTMRRVTEWPETLKNGANRLVDADTDGIVRAVLGARKLQSKNPLDSRNPFGSGRSSERIVTAILSKKPNLSMKT
jgi:UDP-N-acetylglucosamine 2-epimerase (non-hydrolysing)